MYDVTADGQTYLLVNEDHVKGGAEVGGCPYVLRQAAAGVLVS